MLDVAKFFPGKIRQLVGVAVAARKRLPQQVDRQVAEILRRGHGEGVGDVVGHGGNTEDRVMPDAVRAARQFRAADVIAVAVDKFLH